MTGPLDGKVALVAGGTRGAGRGIAVELGAAGVEAARERHAASVDELPADAHRLARGEPALPTVFR